MNLKPNLCLKAKTFIITRANSQQNEARKAFESIGARLLDLPVLDIGAPDQWGPLDDALSDLDSFHWIIFSSVNGVKSVEERLSLKNRSLSLLPDSLKIAAVGRKTASFLTELGVKVDFVPPQFVADSLIKHFPVSGWGLRMLIPRVQSGGRNVLAEAFGKSGARVVEVPAYESRCPKEIPEVIVNALSKKEVHLIAFTSSKTAEHTSKLMNNYFGVDWLQILDSVKIISIGPQTSIGCKKFFYRVDKEANPHDMTGLIDACIKSIEI